MGRRGPARARAGRPPRAPAPAAAGLRLSARLAGPDAVTAGLIAVVLAVPIAFVGEAVGPADDAKAWSLHLLVAATALIALVPWALARDRDTAAPGPDRLARWVGWPAGLYLGWLALTTVTSIAPGQSLWGAFARGHGLTTMTAALALFALLQWRYRRVEDARPLIDAALLGSVPVCALALGQAVGWDPFPTPWDPAIASLPVRSTFGHHIFLGSYLVLLMPLAVARLGAPAPALPDGAADGTRVGWPAIVVGGVWVAGCVGLASIASAWPAAWWALAPWGIAGALAWSWLGARPGRRPGRRVAWGLLTALLGLQVAVVILSRARGAFFGMVVGVTIVGLALLVRRRARTALVAAVAGLLALGAFLVVLNMPDSPLASLGRTPLLERLAQMRRMGVRSPVGVRLHIWRGVITSWGRQVRGEAVIPDTSPRLRALIGYGLETQLDTLDVMARSLLGDQRARWQDQSVRYIVDRAHNDLLDHLVTAGLVGAALWLVATGAVVLVGLRRIGHATGEAERALRWGCLAAVVASVVESQVGVVTPMPRALVWMLSAILVLPGAAPPAAGPGPGPGGAVFRRGRLAILAAAIALAVVVGWSSTRWLLGSVVYARGVQQGLAGDLPAAREAFAQACRLAPWLSLPAEALAQASLRLAAGEADGARRRALLDEADAVLARARARVREPAAPWDLIGQAAMARARGGDPGKLAVATDAFRRAAAQRPSDPDRKARWALSLLESGDPASARRIAFEALTIHRRTWLAWAVLSRASRELGDIPWAERAAMRARDIAPAEARRLVDALLR